MKILTSLKNPIEHPDASLSLLAKTTASLSPFPQWIRLLLTSSSAPKSLLTKTGLMHLFHRDLFKPTQLQRLIATVILRGSLANQFPRLQPHPIHCRAQLTWTSTQLSRARLNATEEGYDLRSSTPKEETIS